MSQSDPLMSTSSSKYLPSSYILNRKDFFPPFSNVLSATDKECFNSFGFCVPIFTLTDYWSLCLEHPGLPGCLSSVQPAPRPLRFQDEVHLVWYGQSWKASLSVYKQADLLYSLLLTKSAIFRWPERKRKQKNCKQYLIPCVLTQQTLWNMALPAHVSLQSLKLCQL